jgi:hypothetical protein
MNEWTNCSDQLPDTDTTVMTFEPDSVEPIWPGYWDGEEWMDIITNTPIHPTHWMDFPEPPEV